MKNFSHYSDDELVQEFIKGNANSFSIIVSRHKDRIFKAIHLLLRDRQLSEDIFQEVFIKVITGLRAGKYTEDGKFVAWVLRIAHNVCIDYLKKKKRPILVLSDNTEDSPLFFSPAADRQLVRNEVRDSVRAMIDRLPPKQREVVILRNYFELPFRQIAALHECNINTVLGRMRYGLLNLKKMVEENGMVMHY